LADPSRPPQDERIVTTSHLLLERDTLMRAIQKRRIKLVQALAERSLGELTIAISLILLEENDRSISSALEYGRQNLDKVKEYLSASTEFRELQFQLVRVWDSINSLNFQKIAEYDRIKDSTKLIFENKIYIMQSYIGNNPSSAIARITKIKSDDKSGSRPIPVEALSLIFNIQENCENMLYHLEHMTPTPLERLTQTKFICSAFGLFIILTPAFYLLSALLDDGSLFEILGRDWTNLMEGAQSGGPAIGRRMLWGTITLFEIMPKIPAAFLLAGIVLTLIRWLTPEGTKINKKFKGFDERFRSLGQSLRDAMSAPAVPAK